VRAADRLHSRFREAEVFDLARLYQFFHRPCNILDRKVRIDPMLIKKVDAVGVQPLQRRGPERLPRSAPIVRFSPVFGGNSHQIALDGRFANMHRAMRWLIGSFDGPAIVQASNLRPPRRSW
jgi:hypothetical protein